MRSFIAPDHEWESVIFCVNTILDSKGTRSFPMTIQTRCGRTIPAKIRAFQRHSLLEDGGFKTETIMVLEPILLFLKKGPE